MSPRLLRAGLLVAFGLSVGVPAQSQSILYFSDYAYSSMTVPGALSGLGFSYTQATGVANFATLLSGGSWDLVIFGEQNMAPASSVMTELTNYMAGGGKLLATSWMSTPLVPFMQAVQMQTDQSPIYTDAHPIFAGLGPSIGLFNPGYGIWSQSYSPTGAAQCLGTLGSYCAGILGHGGRSLLLGPLFDAYANQSQGEQFVAQSAQFLLGDQTVVPEPGTLLLLIPGLIGIGMVSRRRKEDDA